MCKDQKNARDHTNQRIRAFVPPLHPCGVVATAGVSLPNGRASQIQVASLGHQHALHGAPGSVTENETMLSNSQAIFVVSKGCGVSVSF